MKLQLKKLTVITNGCEYTTKAMIYVLMNGNDREYIPFVRQEKPHVLANYSIQKSLSF